MWPMQRSEVELHRLGVLQLHERRLIALPFDRLDPECRGHVVGQGVTRSWLGLVPARNAVLAVPPPGTG